MAEDKVAGDDEIRPMSMCAKVKVSLRKEEMTLIVEEVVAPSAAKPEPSAGSDSTPGPEPEPEPELEPEPEPEPAGTELAEYELTGIIAIVVSTHTDPHTSA